MTAIRLIGEHHQAFVEQFKQLNASRHTHNEPDDNIVYLAHNTVTVDEIKALLDKDAGLVLPISAIQSVTYYQQVKQFVDQINAEVKWSIPVRVIHIFMRWPSNLKPLISLIKLLIVSLYIRIKQIKHKP
ncbi:hypothetical protein [Halolactibacillus sp. JCM 19043]|uniref:hypothetical protein n=1 Tax=Halolactibacillus sp. JCM 19043 TaxID=1460638 RepID=UPI000786087F|nr:hypothetical protein [Halolactibacillus sp. JCM 19043]